MNMKYCVVRSHMSKAGDIITTSTSHMCAERQVIRRLYRECIKDGNKPHSFKRWLRRKYGQMIISRTNIHGDATSIPCVLCRKMLEKYEIKWRAHDGSKWVDSYKDICLPISKPTNKQVRKLGFGETKVSN